MVGSNIFIDSSVGSSGDETFVIVAVDVEASSSERFFPSK